MKKTRKKNVHTHTPNFMTISIITIRFKGIIELAGVELC